MHDTEPAGAAGEAFSATPNQAPWPTDPPTHAPRLACVAHPSGSASTKKSLPEELCIHQRFEAQVHQNPDAVALVHDNKTLSYGQLNSNANRLAHRLIELGVRPDDRVAICVERSFAMVIGILAILKAGGGYVPLDPSYPCQRLAYILQDSEPILLLVDAGGRQALAQATFGPKVLDIGTPEADWSHHPTTSPDPSALGLTSSHLAYVIYTSGSTGAPKGVMVEHAQVTRLFESTNRWFKFGAEDVWCLFHSIGFDFSVWELWGALRYGGRLIVVPHDIARSAPEFYRLVCQYEITVLNQTPSAFKAFIQAQLNSRLEHRLRYVIFGGEALEPSILRPWYANHRDNRPQLINMYGITETTVHVTYRVMQEADTEKSGSPIGQRIPDLKIYLLDSERQPVPWGAIGEIYVGGPGVARGYLNRPELTAERFQTDPFSGGPGMRMYRSGDLARYLPNGSLEFLGRNDQQVKIRGFRIEPGEIEKVLGQYPLVKSCAVIAREDRPGEKQLVGYVVLNDSPRDVTTEIRNYLRERLPQYMVPAFLVELKRLPLTLNGKLDRRELPAPSLDHPGRSLELAPARTQREKTLTRIWSELLGLESISVNDNFFDLGGDSLSAIHLISMIGKEFKCSLSIRKLLQAPTVAELSQEIELLNGSAHIT